MTQKDIKLKSRRKNRADFVNLFVSLSILIFTISLSINLSPEISDFVRQGLLLCYTTIIPSVFPFMIVSDLMLACIHFEKIGFIRMLFSKLFKVNGYAISALVCGALCGFPVGVKIAKDLYIGGKITKDECERLIGFTNNASPAFVICGVGYGLRGSVRDGVLLYLFSILSSLFCAFIFSLKEPIPKENKAESSFDFSLTVSVQNASYNTLNICGFITLFSVILGLLKRFIKSNAVFAILSAFFEIGNAAKLISDCSAFSYKMSLIITAFAVSFSGLSVHLQSKSLLTGTDISMKKYYSLKFLSGIFSIVLMTFFIYLFL